MNALSAKPLDLPTRLDLGFEELSRQELRDMMNQRGLKKRTHKILKFVQTVDQKKTFRYQILTLLPEPDPRPSSILSPHKTAFDFTFDRSKSLHSTEQKKQDASFDRRKEEPVDLKRLPSLLGNGQALLEASKGDLGSTKAHKSRIAKTVTRMKMAHTQALAGPQDSQPLFAARHVVDLSVPDAREPIRPQSATSSGTGARKTTSPPVQKSPMLAGAQPFKQELLQPQPEPEAQGLATKAEWGGRLEAWPDEEQSSWELRRALESEPRVCAETLAYVRGAVESISRVFGVEPSFVIELWLRCESSELVVKKLALDLALNT